MKTSFNNSVLDGDKGKLMLEITKTFRGDNRFQLDQRFEKDVEVDQMPEKFKQKMEQDLLQRVKEKTKHIKKEQPPLIIRRFQPGTKKGEVIERKAEGKKQYVQSVMKAEKKKMKKVNVYKGIDRIKKADQLLQQSSTQKTKSSFKIEVKGDRQQAFKASHFKLFQ